MSMDSIFTYFISKSKVEFEELQTSYSFGGYVVNTDSKTPFKAAQADGRECAVFGYAVDVITGESEALPQKMLEKSTDVFSLVEYEKCLGGKYIVLYKDEKGMYVLGDATTSVPVYYTAGSRETAVTSNPEYLCRSFGFEADEVLQKIRNSGDISQAMPFDVTPYKEIKQMIPNHFLSLDEAKAYRFVNSTEKQKTLSIDEATELAAPMIQNLVSYYAGEFDLVCPITSGRDSRVVLAFLQATFDKPVKSYTIKHKRHKDTDDDVAVPFELAKATAMDYKQIADVPVSDELQKQADIVLGKGKYSTNTLEIANTIKTYYGDSAIINGDTIGQVGKCSLHRDIPSCLATPAYFRCKLHNYSDEAKKLLGVWLKEIKNSGEKVNTFDLFSVESRVGRWAGKENTVYNTVGQTYINVFNSRSIIYVWTAVKRGERKNSALHFALIKKKNPDLLKVRFGASKSRVVKLSKSNGIFYYVSSFSKFYMDKKKFFKASKGSK